MRRIATRRSRLRARAARGVVRAAAAIVGAALAGALALGALAGGRAASPCMRLRLSEAPTAASMRAPLRLEREGTECCRSAALPALGEREANAAAPTVAPAAWVRLGSSAFASVRDTRAATAHRLGRGRPPRPPPDTSTTILRC